MTEPLEISDLVRELRQRRSLTQEQFAAELGVTFPTINRWENKKSRPSKLAFQLLQSKVLELGEDDLIDKYFPDKKSTKR